MKNYALASVAAVVAIGATAQINAPGNDGFRSRAGNMLRQSNSIGAIDQLDVQSRGAMAGDELRQAEFMYAQQLFAAGRYADALNAFSTYVLKYPFSNERDLAQKGVGDCLFVAKDYKGAVKAYVEADAAALPQTDAAELAFRLGIAYMQCGKSNEARSALEYATRYAEMRSEAAYYLGCMDFNDGNYAAARERFKSVASASKVAPMADFYLTCISFAEGNYSKAFTDARQAARRSELPASAIAELDRIAGESLYHLERGTEAVDFLQKYVGAVENPMPSALYILGVNEFEQGGYSSALEYFRPVTEHGTGALRQSAYLYAGQCLLEQGDTSAAILAFDKAAKADDDAKVREVAMYNYVSAKLAGASVPFASSVDMLEDFLRLYPDGPYSERVAAYLATGYMADNDYERALSRLNKISNPSPKTLEARQRVLYTLGTAAIGDGRLLDADRYLSEASTLARYNAAVAAETALSQAHLLMLEGDNAAAAAKYDEFLKAPAAKNSINRGVALYGAAYTYYNMHDLARAESMFNDALPANSNPEVKADILNRLGDIKFAGSKFADAEGCYLRAVEANPQAGDYAALNAAKMKGYMRDYNGKLEALAAFRSKFGSSVLMPDALLETTQAYISLGRNEEAVETYKTLIAEYPQTAQGRRGYLQMAMTLLDMNRTADAIDAYRSVIAKYPTSDEAMQASSLLKTLYADSGRADEYLNFISTVENAPELGSEEAAELVMRSADALAQSLDAAIENGNAESAHSIANRILERYPDTRAAEKALAYLAHKAYTAGELPEALEMYGTLAQKASDAATATEARIGVMRAARDMGNLELAGTTADAILASSASPAALPEAKYTKAASLSAAGNDEAALAIWLELAAEPADVFGARSACEAAEALHEAGDNDRALAVATKLVSSGSPQRYWVARGFIVLSDIYAAQGKAFEAREYLIALRDNYPGTEADIFMMIESRLSDEKQQTDEEI